MPTLHGVNIIVPALAAAALALACVLSPLAGAAPAGAPPVGYGGNGVFGMSTQPSDVAGSLFNVALAVA